MICEYIIVRDWRVRCLWVPCSVCVFVLRSNVYGKIERERTLAGCDVYARARARPEIMFEMQLNARIVRDRSEMAKACI